MESASGQAKAGFHRDPPEWTSITPAIPRSVTGGGAVLGIMGCPHSHDAAAALVCEGRIVAAVEEERFRHIKHVGAYPFFSIDACLRRAGLSFGEIDRIVFGIIPDRFKRTILDEPLAREQVSPAAVESRTRLVESFKGVVPALQAHYGVSCAEKFHWINHHTAHAASAYFASGFEESVVLSVDGSGDRECAALFRGRGGDLSLEHSFLDYPESLGRFYDMVTRFVIGMPQHGLVLDAGKLMGLAGYGKADPEYFSGLVEIDDGDDYRPVRFDMSYFSVHSGEYPFSRKWRERFGAPRSRNGNFEAHHFAMAASAQAVLERAMVAMVRAAKRLFPNVENLCLSGGTTLNVCANRRIHDDGRFERLFIAPAANDAGTALGAALYGHALATGCRRHEYSVYSGPDIAVDFDIEGILRSFGGRIAYEKLPEAELCERVADRLARNQIVGWAQGCMEFGPRALGNRSLLTNPGNPLSKDIMNAKAKKREHYRPYAPSVLQEECSRWFDIDASPHMLLEARLLPGRRGTLPGITHVDGTTRPQTVTEQDNPRYHRLLREFHQRTGLPALLNTSLNGHGETIVNSPLDAVLFLLGSEIDAIAVGDFLVTRAG